MSLIDKIRKSRESSLSLGDVKLTIRRPTVLEATTLIFSSTFEGVEKIAEFVINWEGVNEIDLLPGGSGTPVPFSPDVFMEWISDCPEHWGPLIEGVKSAYENAQKKRAAELGN